MNILDIVIIVNHILNVGPLINYSTLENSEYGNIEDWAWIEAVGRALISDVNSDGVVNILDIVSVVGSILGTNSNVSYEIDPFGGG